MTAAAFSSPADWLPEGKRCAICLTVDDVHPAKSSDLYEAGGDLGEGALRHVQWLTERHPDLKVTLFTPADWREKSPVPTRRALAAIPYLRDRVYLAARWPKGTMQLDRHPAFVSFLKGMKNVEVGLHGLHHCSKGPRIPLEFENRSYRECATALRQIIEIMESAGLPYARGMTPPGWSASPALLQAMVDAGLKFVASACDVHTPISPAATAQRRGLRGHPLIFPSLLEEYRLVQIPANFQATSTFDRALAILQCGGLLSIKAHIVKSACGHVALDGMDTLYANYLDVTLSRLRDQFGDSIWWARMSEIGDRVLAREKEHAGVAFA